MFKLFGRKTLPYRLLSVAEVGEWLRQKTALVLDVREPYEFAEWHIRDAKLIPLDRLIRPHNALGPKDRAIIVVCRDGNRSEFAANQLSSLGYNQVASLKGGLQSWLKAGMAVEI